MFRVIIAGGRDFKHSEKHYEWIERILSKKLDIEFVDGGATGADWINKIMADRLLAGRKDFLADWTNLEVEPCVVKYRADGTPYNALAGFNRNEAMALYASAVEGERGALIIFPGGNGSADMLKRAKKHGLLIRQWRKK